MYQRPLTAKQKKLLEFIINFIHKNRIAPTIRDICKHFKFASPKSAQDQLLALEKKGYINKIPNAKRAMTLTSKALMLKLLGTIPAGNPVELQNMVENEFEIILRLKKKYPDAYVVRVQGESMIDAGILNGDYAIISKNTHVSNGDIAAVIIDNKVTLKKVKIVGEKLYLQPANSKLPPIEVTSEIYILGKLIGIYREI